MANKRVLLLSATTGYQLRAFNEAAGRLGVTLTFATDRCHMLDDPWRDAAVPVRFYDEAASLQALAEAAVGEPFAGILAVGDRPAVLAALAAERLGLAGNSPAAARACANKRLSREAIAWPACRLHGSTPFPPDRRRPPRHQTRASRAC